MISGSGVVMLPTWSVVNVVVVNGSGFVNMVSGTVVASLAMVEVNLVKPSSWSVIAIPYIGIEQV